MDTVRARKAMVDCQVRPNDVPDVRLQRAMESIPREAFVPANRHALAYVEKDLELFEGRWLLKARDLSKLIHSLTLTSDDLVLDVACGNGYSTALMAHLANVVVGLEDSADVVTRANETAADLGIDNIAFVEGPLADGASKQGPFDAILVAGGVEEGLDSLLAQLKPDGGRLATIVLKDGVGCATIFTRRDDIIGQRTVFEAHPAATLSAFQRKPQFIF